MTRIKICGITRLDDGIAAARAGADAIGFVFWPGTPRRIDIERARSIADELPPLVSIVGLFVDPTAEEVRAVLDRVPLDVLQFHGHESPALCRSFGRRYLKAFAVDQSGRLLESLASYGDAAAWLFDAPPAEGRPGGTGRTFDWSRLPSTLERPVVLSGGLNAANVAAAIRATRPWGVDVSSGVEARDANGRPMAGIKDAQKVDAFIREVRNADV
ncbi:MAG TPA: phosphoribosylanthranilate isomerase [Casimicrobiaceae bacterium]|nr:phosphoribosylanthranilate isomerase [Casimicrobiaceae bacterium]